MFELAIIIDDTHPLLLALSDFWFDLLNLWAIDHWESISYIIPQVLCNLDMWDCWAESRLNVVSYPRHQERIDSPPILDVYWVIYRFCNCPVDEAKFFPCSQSCAHRPRPFIIIFSFQLHLGDWKAWIVKTSNVTRRYGLLLQKSSLSPFLSLMVNRLCLCLAIALML